MKPLQRKAYGSIGHLHGSRLGEHDRFVTEGEHRIFTEKVKNKGERIIIQEKMDGSCCAVAKVSDTEIVCLTRKGHDAQTSPFEQHRMFADWVEPHKDVFLAAMDVGDRVVGEWLAQAHGTKYNSVTRPWFVFDYFDADNNRKIFNDLYLWIVASGIMSFATIPLTLNEGRPCSVANAWNQLTGVRPNAEGMVYRRENEREVISLAKWVRPDYEPGKYLPEVSGHPIVWNWRP